MPIHQTYRTKTIVEAVVDNYQCNVCGKLRSDDWHQHDMHNIALRGGYSGFYPTDMDTVSFVVCGPCLLKWTETFQIPPEGKAWDLTAGIQPLPENCCILYAGNVYKTQNGIALRWDTKPPAEWPEWEDNEDGFYVGSKNCLYQTSTGTYVHLLDILPFYPDCRYLLVYRDLEDQQIKAISVTDFLDSDIYTLVS